MVTTRLRHIAPLLVLMLLGGRIPTARAQSQLDTLVAPIALYPDPLVAQILPASTYPIQVVDAARATASGRRPDQQEAAQWDPSVQALISFPSVLKMMNDKLDWTTKLGQAVAANQGEVMAAIQHVRQQAQAAGNLKSNDKQVVAVQGSTIVIQPASPEMIYVPQYDPVAIVAPAPAYYAAPAYGLMTFGAGFAAGAATAYACNWGSGSGNVTVSNTYKYSQTNNYGAYNANAKYNENTGAYHGYDSKTGTYGAYNPETGKYATYNPQTGAYNKDGTTGTYQKPPSSTQPTSSAWKAPDASSVGRSGESAQANQYRSGNTSQAETASERPSSAGRSQYGGDEARSGSASDRGLGGGFGDRGGGGWGEHDNDAFRGAGGGGWGAQNASERGERSAGGRSFGGGGFGGGGFGGGRRR